MSTKTPATPGASKPEETHATHPLRALFDQAMELPASERAAWIDANVVDGDHRQSLLRLVAAADADDDAAGVLDTPAGKRAERIGEVADTAIATFIGNRIGAFRLTRLLGQGGMAAVFLGEREGADFRQQVAVKLLRRGLYSEIDQRLFRRERQALATLSHPNIAHLIDGGVTDTGIPFLVIEYIDGVPITTYATENQLDLRARLRLFAIVCRAVSAAHGRLIVHRDIKPSNILVTPAGEVKLLDFGIAKLLDDAEDAATRTGLAALTPGYAAPEQYTGGAITTATDVYALGVLLHEMLLGERPHVRAGTAQRPSSRLEALVTDLWSLPAPRLRLRTALRGDLDNIMLKALEPEPERRYASAAEFANDIDRHLAAEPVKAHPPSRWYRTRKFVQRHRGGVLTTVAFTLALVTSLAVALWQATVARSEAARASEQSLIAQAESQRANEVRNFIEELFESINEGFPEHRTPDVKDLVAAGVTRLRANTTFGTSERIDLLMMFARLHERLGEPEPARALSDEAVTLADRELDALHPRAIEALALRGDLAVRVGNLPAAEAPLREALRRLRIARLESSLLHDVLDSLANIETSQGHAEAALQLVRESLAERIRIYGADSVGAAAGHNNVGVALFGLGQFEEAANEYRRTYEIDARHQATDSYYVLFSLSNWAHALAMAGRIGEARGRLVEVEAAMQQLGGKPRQGQIVNRSRLCLIDALFRDPETAKASCAGLLPMARAYSDGGGAYMAVSLHVDAIRLREAGELRAAATLLEDPAALLSDDPSHARFRGNTLQLRASLAWLAGDVEASRHDAATALALLTPFASSAAAVAELQALLSLSCTGADRGCAQPDANDLDTRLASPRAHGNSHYLLAAMLRLQGKIASGQAEMGLEQLDAVLPGAIAELGETHALIGSARIWRAIALSDLGRCEAAATEQAKAASAKKGPGRANPWLLQAMAQTPAGCKPG